MKLARENRDRPAAAVDAATAAAADTVAVAKVAAREEGTNRVRKQRSETAIWAGLDSNQRRRKASRFTVCPVWPLRYLPVSASVDIGSRCAPRKWFGHRARFGSHRAFCRGESAQIKPLSFNRRRVFVSPHRNQGSPACQRH